MQEYEEQKNSLFCVELMSAKSPGSHLDEFSSELFCQALSLSSNSPVQASVYTEFLALDRLYNLSFGIGSGCVLSFRPDGSQAKIGDTEIEESKRLYRILVDHRDVQEKLRVPINRWILSKADRDEVDRIIDLGIALEALYVPDGGGDTTYKFAIRAARYLGKDKRDREDLLVKFKQIYNCRSKAVHAGLVDTTIKFGGEKIDWRTFIAHAQDLCLQSIKKILDEGKLTDWDSLILSGEIDEADN